MRKSAWLAIGWLFLAVAANAYVLYLNGSGTPRRWNLSNPQSSGVNTNSVNPNTHAIRYYLAAEGYSAGNVSAELNALRASIGQWLSISNTSLKFEEAGLANAPVDINLNDHTNVIYWTKSSTLVNGGTYDIGGATGVTFLSWNGNNVLLEADLVLNGKTYSWFTDVTDTANNGNLVEGVALHELGHFLGITHTPVAGATMVFLGPAGANNLQARLSADDIAGIRFLYGQDGTNSGAITGTVTKNGSPVLGAQVFIQDAASNLVAGVMSLSSGSYTAGMLPPGTYQVRAAPLALNASARLVAAPDIDASFNSADLAFLPTVNISTVVTANATNTVNLAVSNRTPAFRITHIRAPTTSSGSYAYFVPAVPVKMAVGQSNYYVGVGAASFPTANASLTITGDGLTLGNSTFANQNGISFVSASISISSNATPGLRSFIVTQYGTNVAYANGYLEIQPATMDWNFDGVNDLYQRQYFPVFTATNAGPNADPDGDGVNNYAESIAGTVPTNAGSYLKMRSVARTNNTATIRWDSVNGKRYQMTYRTNLDDGSWQNVGAPVTAGGTNALYSDTAASNAMRIYRVQPLP